MADGRRLMTALRPALAQLWNTIGRLCADFRPTLGPLWADFGPTLGRLLVNFRSTLGRLWTDFGPTLDRLWINFGPTLDRLWTDLVRRVQGGVPKLLGPWGLLQGGGGFWASDGLRQAVVIIVRLRVQFQQCQVCKRLLGVPAIRRAQQE